ncbi:hypothetical protein IKF81_02385 [Candidatus Saccharibacteria bacterium]|nr:hypothetical protein [Candidatus Saccharibacteria bacterium]
MKDGRLSDLSLKSSKKRQKCPKCGKYYVGYPATSRKDNKTGVCPKCGLYEALEIFILQI